VDHRVVDRHDEEAVAIAAYCNHIRDRGGEPRPGARGEGERRQPADRVHGAHPRGAHPGVKERLRREPEDVARERVIVEAVGRDDVARLPREAREIGSRDEAHGDAKELEREGLDLRVHSASQRGEGPPRGPARE
jgi:hypothetical protein